MEEYSILVTRIAYSDGQGFKVRPALVLKFNGELIRVFRITSQYEHKSDYIKSRYFEILDWYKAGLRKPSWIDTIKYYDIQDNGFNIKVIGRLSQRDLERLKKFLTDTDL
ncbi:hypothetical protein [Streptococcus merionis]|uniref:hypothetical protein n=1 Tax=Streptococcus merionis TaxID=400065 RepID=UPI0035190718